ncbi:MAG: TRAM domain-containing protein, partial [Clostridia bacterium]|nr:TRAM domain-containing protein [Clostridia bacterium]
MRLIRDLTAENETVDGEGVARHEGKVIFVRGMMRGETGDVSVTEEGKRFSRGTLAALAAASPDRIAPACPHYAVCGG